jgi:hypothetical protein
MEQKPRMRRCGAEAFSMVLVIALALPMIGQLKDSDSPILEAREISGGCCQSDRNTTYLRVFSDGKAEWDEFDYAKKSYVAHQAVLSKKQMRAIQWAVDNMKGLASFYSGKYAKGNIDSEYTFSIMGRKKDTNYRTEIFFGLAVDAENYSELPARVRAVACNVSVTRGQLTNETTDFDSEFCRKYYVGW